VLRRILTAAVVLFVVSSLVLAGEYTGIITKIDKDEVTIKVRKDKDDKEGTEKKFKVGKDVKIVRKAKDKDDEKVEMKAFGEAVEKAAKAEKGIKGVFATIKTEGKDKDETVTEIATRGRGGK
jgi:hypothetical protein